MKVFQFVAFLLSGLTSVCGCEDEEEEIKWQGEDTKYQDKTTLKLHAPTNGGPLSEETDAPVS